METNPNAYGINIEFAHPRAIELIPENFFWDCVDEMAPFGSDEGDIALMEYRDWRKKNPDKRLYEWLKSTIECIGQMSINAYDNSLLDEDLILYQIMDWSFDDHYHVFLLDLSVYATGFGQLVDEGTIDQEIKPLIQIALSRQKIWAALQKDWKFRYEYIDRMKVLERALKEA